MNDQLKPAFATWPISAPLSSGTQRQSAPKSAPMSPLGWGVSFRCSVELARQRYQSSTPLWSTPPGSRSCWRVKVAGSRCEMSSPSKHEKPTRLESVTALISPTDSACAHSHKRQKPRCELWAEKACAGSLVHFRTTIHPPLPVQKPLNGTETYSPHWRALLGPDTEKVDAHGRQ